VARPPIAGGLSRLRRGHADPSPAQSRRNGSRDLGTQPVRIRRLLSGNLTRGSYPGTGHSPCRAPDGRKRTVACGSRPIAASSLLLNVGQDSNFWASPHVALMVPAHSEPWASRLIPRPGGRALGYRIPEEGNSFFRSLPVSRRRMRVRSRKTEPLCEFGL